MRPPLTKEELCNLASRQEAARVNRPSVARPLHSFRILPGFVQLAKVQAAKRRLPLGQWLEQAIADRAKRDVEDELNKAAAEFVKTIQIGKETK